MVGIILVVLAAGWLHSVLTKTFGLPDSANTWILLVLGLAAFGLIGHLVDRLRQGKGKD